MDANLKEENAKLKRLLADFTLDKHMLEETLRRKSVKPRRRRELVGGFWLPSRPTCARCAAGGKVVRETLAQLGELEEGSAVKRPAGKRRWAPEVC